MTLPNWIALTALVILIAGTWLHLRLLSRLRRPAPSVTTPLPAARDASAHRALAQQQNQLVQRLAELERTLKTLQQRPAPTVAAAEPAYEIAVQLARRGTGVDELARTCHIGRAEAELIVRLHGPSASNDARRTT